ncbi:hypothetical protein P8452_57347 [Trifolium repens]|nr:hypothetical protein P8452_57347 [Trifolium repens]
MICNNVDHVIKHERLKDFGHQFKIIFSQCSPSSIFTVADFHGRSSPSTIFTVNDLHSRDLHLFQKHNCNRIHNRFSSIHNCNRNSPIQSATPRFAFRIASRFTIAIAAPSFNIAIPQFTIASLQFGD